LRNVFFLTLLFWFIVANTFLMRPIEVGRIRNV